MNLNDYQSEAIRFALPKACYRQYAVLGLCSEAGEVAGKVKKMMRGDLSDGEGAEAIKAELGDVIWYLALCAELYGLRLSDIAQANLDKLASRKERGVLRGNGDER